MSTQDTHMNYREIHWTIDFKRLQSQLSLPRYAASGVITSIWTLTGFNAPRGDIGQYPNEVIAEHIEWEGSADKLIHALVRTNWLINHPKYRLVVAHWFDVCGKQVHTKLARERRWFWDGSIPSVRELIRPEKIEAREFYQTHKMPEDGGR